ncbi:MAG: endo-1,4-beta-xylanase, partial [Planctomycetota bacterium]|nr:endo-1,4-beta-xylanase [Planctomycetota bacterium]
MLKFVVFEDRAPATRWPLRHARLLGHDAAALPGTVRFNNGAVECEKSVAGSAALTLQWDAGPAGVLMLQTCLLPERDRPYLLSLELARHRIMLSLMKLEEWAQFTTPQDHPVSKALAAAHATFMRALSCSPAPDGLPTAQQDDLAREALIAAIQAGEMLTEKHASEQLQSRLDANAESTERRPAPYIGCVVRTDRIGDVLQSVIRDSFDFITLPLPWKTLEPEEGSRYQFQPADRWIEWAVRKGGVPVVAGPIIDFRPQSVPDWLYIWENDYETLRDLVYEHLKRIVTRYRRVVQRWTVVSGLNVNSNFTLSLEQLIDLTRLCALVVRKLQPNAQIIIEVDQPFGEYVADNQHGVPPLLYTELLFQAAVDF